MKNILSIICLLIISMTLYSDTLGTNPKYTIPDAIFHKEIGVLLEPSGHYYTYGGYVIVPVVYTMPKLKMPHILSSCNETIYIQEAYDDMKQKTLDVIGHNQHDIRDKRAIPLIVGGATVLVLSLYNTYAAWDAQRSLNAITEEQDTILYKLQNVHKAENIILNNGMKLSAILSQHQSTLNDVLAYMECNDMGSIVKVTNIINTVNKIGYDFEDAYASLLGGKVTPTLLKHNEINTLFNNNKDLGVSAYRDNPNMLYELGEAYYISIIEGDGLAITGMMLFPKLNNMKPVPLYNVHSVNYVYSGKNYRVILDSQLACQNATSCLSIDHSTCIKRPHMLVCEKALDQQEDRCYKSVVTRNITSCGLQISEDLKQTMITQVGIGILVGATTDEIKIGKFPDETWSTDHTLPGTKSPILVTPNDGRYVVFRNNIYSTSVRRMNYSIIYTPEGEIYHPEKSSQLPIPDWKDLSDELAGDTYVNLPEITTNHKILMYSLICTVIIMAILTGYMIYIKIKEFKVLGRYTKQLRTYSVNTDRMDTEDLRQAETTCQILIGSHQPHA